ncbi:hypothetical protein HYH03_000699 [Edaphochlamys debaryana]|uniref:phosphoglucomutase (alpha-D-glucose-1,6-bisphosphate-dependent) n=1 Tax=Edaphochlamys debaryana TaxID=47281 RepID=A0A836C7F8_9CHLO|nr:hypothetical protein HYH03_000699 [Edaphochlamys debaryana]|eukprot:KAG2502213.1 hypothetical protein HYH03_000699 [Edaphochlamys debaryana]
MRLTQTTRGARAATRSRDVCVFGPVPARRVASVRVSAAMAAVSGVTVKEVPTKPYEGQKTGTSGLRKKTKEFMQPNYLANWVQSLFAALGDEVKGKSLGLGGDGRYYGKEAAQIIIKLAAGNGFKRVVVGQDALMATPAASALIRQRKLYGGLIMSASHNPGGPENDFGIKFNYSGGEPAPERITDKIYGETTKVAVLNMADIPDVDLSKIGVTKFGDFEVEVVDPVADYLVVLKEVFDFPMLKTFLARKDFSLVFDAMHAVTGPYAKRILVEELGAPASCVKDGVPSPDFNGGHPDPNLTYAEELVKIMWADKAPAFGAASDGDGDRNMVLGDKFFVNPSDSVAIIAANAQACIPYFKQGLKGVARSMPTSGALDRVAADLKLPFFETPTGWKFFGNLMDAGKCSVCGEESFGTGGDHIREKDGIFAVLAWLSILAHANKGVPDGGKLVTVADVATKHWQKYGRNFFSRYDYEECASADADKMVAHLRDVIAKSKKGDKFGEFVLEKADDFEYVDPIDGSKASKQGLRFVFSDGSRIIFRLSGTGSSGATVRLYIEQYTNDPAKLQLDAQKALGPIIQVALEMSQLEKFTGRKEPTVIT